MKSKLTIALLIVGVLSIAAWSIHGQTGKDRNVTYEYAVIEDPVAQSYDDEMKLLNKFGAQGWEIVGINQLPNSSPTKIYLKRTIK